MLPWCSLPCTGGHLRVCWHADRQVRQREGRMLSAQAVTHIAIGQPRAAIGLK